MQRVCKESVLAAPTPVRGGGPGLHDVHVLAAHGVVQPAVQRHGTRRQYVGHGWRASPNMAPQIVLGSSIVSFADHLPHTNPLPPSCPLRSTHQQHTLAHPSAHLPAGPVFHASTPPQTHTPEQLGVVVGNLQEGEVVHGAPPLVRHVVQHQHRPRKVVLAVVPVVGLQGWMKVCVCWFNDSDNRSRRLHEGARSGRGCACASRRSVASVRLRRHAAQNAASGADARSPQARED